MSVGIVSGIVAVISLTVGLVIHIVTVAYNMGKMTGTIAALVERVTKLEARPDCEAAIARVSTALEQVVKGWEKFEVRVDGRLVRMEEKLQSTVERLS